jgi:hypothetical protein
VQCPTPDPPPTRSAGRSLSPAPCIRWSRRRRGTNRGGMRRDGGGGKIPSRYLQRRRFQKAALIVRLFQQVPDFLLQRFVAVRSALHPHRSPAGVLFQSLVVNSLDFLPALRLHAASLRSIHGAANSWPSSSPAVPSPPKYPEPRRSPSRSARRRIATPLRGLFADRSPIER